MYKHIQTGRIQDSYYEYCCKDINFLGVHVSVDVVIMLLCFVSYGELLKVMCYWFAIKYFEMYTVQTIQVYYENILLGIDDLMVNNLFLELNICKIIETTGICDTLDSGTP